MMISKLFTFSMSALFALSLALSLRAEDAAEPQVDEALEAEIAYVEALIDAGYPDFAEPVIKATKVKWPEADVRFFAIEVKGLLSLGKFVEANNKIAALPDRKSSKYWAARLQLANNYFYRNKKNDCKQIYEEFFKVFANPPKDLLKFYMEASYQWGQILTMDNRLQEATVVYERLLGQKLSAEQRCMMGCELCELYIRLATDAKDGKKRGEYLNSASRWADDLLNHPEKALYFGRAVSMKAHIELMRGKVSVAQDIVEEFLPQLGELHENIVKYDPDGRKGVRKLSPLPQCRFLMAKMLWQEAQTEYKKPKRNDEKVKEFLFGAKVGGKRNGQGAYNHSLNVFIKYPESAWAEEAGQLCDQIENFANEKYQAKIQKKITPELIANVRNMQFKVAADLINEGKREQGINEYMNVLAKYPEFPESITAVETMLTAYLDLWLNEKDAQKKEWYRMCADSVEGYLIERFNSKSDKVLMTTGGDAVLRAAGKEKERGNPVRALELRKAFAINYRKHANAPTTAATLASEAQKARNYEAAIELWDILGKYYTNSTYYASSLAQASTCYDKLNNRQAAIAAMKKYVEVETVPVRKTQAQMSLAQMYQKTGFDMMKSIDSITNETEKSTALSTASAQIIRGIKEFKGFADKSKTLLADETLPKGDRELYSELRDTAMFLVGDCWARLKKPEDKIEMFRKRSAESFEEYVSAYPEGKYAKVAYVKLGMIYTAIGDMEKSKAALDRLTKAFPDSNEAKNAKPSLAKALIEMGFKKEGTEIYAEMLKTDGAYTPIQFYNAGEALIEARSWDMASQAFQKAIRLAGTNFVSTVARSRVGEAKSLYKQKRYAEARDSLDAFLEDEKMSRNSVAAEANLLLAEIASEQGRTEKDLNMRGKHFGAAVGAIKKLRTYWRNKPLSEQDTIDLMSADIVIGRMRAEEAMGLTEEAADTRAKAAAMLQSFLQARGISESNPVEKLTEGDLNNLERCYSTMVPLFAAMGPAQASRVIKFGEEYLQLFPNGKARTEISNCINMAKADASHSAATTKKVEEK